MLVDGRENGKRHRRFLREQSEGEARCHSDASPGRELRLFPALAQKKPERQQVKDRDVEVRNAVDPGHGLTVNRMQREKCRRDQRQPLTRKKFSGNNENEPNRDAVQQ